MQEGGEEMVNRAVRSATPRRVHPRGAKVALAKPNYVSISQLERERERRESFEKGSRWAGLAMVAMFLFLSFGCVMWAW